MHPVCFYIFGRPVYWYGVMVATGFMLGVVNWHLVLRKEGRRPEFAADMGFWLMISGVIGARIAYIIANFRYFIQEPLLIFRVDQGGLIFYGGFIGATVAVVVLSRIRKEPLLAFADFTVTSLPLGHAVGRIGCFLNGCCFGKACDLPWAVNMQEAFRHPVQLYEAALNFILYLVLLKTYFSKGRDGVVLSLYLMGYAVVRFMTEFFRGDERLRLFFLSYAQWLSVLLFVIGAVTILLLPDKRIRQNRISGCNENV